LAVTSAGDATRLAGAEPSCIGLANALIAAAALAACLQMSPMGSLGDESPAAGIVLLTLTSTVLAALRPRFPVLLFSSTVKTKINNLWVPTTLQWARKVYAAQKVYAVTLSKVIFTTYN